jgi:hypothetical protein
MAFEEIRHQVAISGHVTDAHTGRALAKAQVRIINAPDVFVDRLVILAKGVWISDPALATARVVLDNSEASVAQRLEAAQTILDFLQARRLVTSRRPDRTQTAADGIFFFTDLPAGDYTLTATLTGFGTRYGQGQTTATVTSDDGNIALVTADIAIPSTTVRGQITGPNDDGANEPVFMAEVRVKGSGECVFSASDGRYLLAGLEVGKRSISVSARGYATLEQIVQLDQAGTEQSLNFTLVL